MNGIKEENKNVKRAAVFVFFDRNGVVDNYVTYLLDGIKSHISRLVIVVNGKINEDGLLRLKQFSDEKDIVIRENRGFDTMAYREGMYHIGFLELKNYDELLLFNDTVMGPVFPFSEMFDEMDKRELDFYGITLHYENKDNPYNTEYGYIPEHIQTYFMVIRKNMFLSDEFINYFKNLPVINSYEDAVGKHEVVFTKKFSDLSFKYGAYIDSPALRKMHEQPLIALADHIIKEMRCPVFKKRLFFLDYSYTHMTNDGSISRNVFDFVDKETDFPSEYIFENLLRSKNLYDLSLNFHFNRILPGDVSFEDAGEYLFKKEKKLGLITRPAKNFGEYNKLLFDAWDMVFSDVKRLSVKTGLNVLIDLDTPPLLAFNLDYIIRDELFERLKKYIDAALLNESFDEKMKAKILERLIPYFVQEMGYYTVCAESAKYFENDIDNLRAKLSKRIIGLELNPVYDEIERLREVNKELSLEIEDLEKKALEIEDLKEELLKRKEELLKRNETIEKKERELSSAVFSYDILEAEIKKLKEKNGEQI